MQIDSKIEGEVKVLTLLPAQQPCSGKSLLFAVFDSSSIYFVSLAQLVRALHS